MIIMEAVISQPWKGFFSGDPLD